MAAVANNPGGHRHVTRGHDMRLWIEHLLEDERFAWLLLWFALLLTLAFFAIAPLS
ncbi:MAG TPA: hypothetical protein P5279_06745 [Anaerohalosphaeraceae bacterium]|jgi:hypothetical protein|nr:hypothetical protein [Anaerohalosphaeraceae bacterium]HRT50171.1 hypothetical protein [Anaerohalosphaeraceae bacterium]HRT86102.1 hypothetical protein [Anaerohalosphaeraceae bacterium]